MSNEKKKHVLVAEDDNVSRMLVLHLLKGLGYRVTAAVDGAEALGHLGIDHAQLEGAQDSAAAYEQVDLLLMDLNMPEMDGFEACSLLRMMEQKWQERGVLKRGVRKPVIGMSATKRSDEWGLCRDAGMDDLLEKPIDKVKAARVLEQYLARAAVNAEQSARRMEADAPALLVLNVRWLVEAVDGNAGLLEEVVGDFLAQMPGYLDRLAEAAGAGDGPAIADAAHKVAGSAAYVGAEELCQAAKDVEAAAKKTADVGPGVAAVREAFAQAARLLEKGAAELIREGA